MYRDDKTAFVGYVLVAGRSAKETLVLQVRHQGARRHVAVWLASGVMLALTLLIGCGSSTDVVAVEPTLDVPPPTPTDFPPPPTATPVATATAVPTPTTEAATPTPTVEPTPTLLPEGAVPPAMAEEAEILDVHRRFMTELFTTDQRNAAEVERFLALAEELTRGGMREGILEGLEMRRQSGSVLVGEGLIFTVTEIGYGRNGKVQVFDCSLDTGTIYRDGRVEVEAATTFTQGSTIMSKAHDGWKVEHLNPGGEPCQW